MPFWRQYVISSGVSHGLAAHQLYVHPSVRPTTKVMCLSTDRPDIAIVRARLKRYDKKSYQMMLHFVVVEASKRPDRSRLSVFPGFSQLRDSDSNISTVETRWQMEQRSQITEINVYSPIRHTNPHQLGDIRYLFMHGWLGWLLEVSAANSYVVRGRFALDDLESGISEILTSNKHKNNYAIYAIWRWYLSLLLRS